MDSSGKSWAFIPANKTGKGHQSFSSEFEIMRGDMCEIMYDETKDRAKYVFGKWVESYEDSSDGVEVRFSDGTTDRFDLLVGADGQRSRTRRMLLGAADANSIEHLGTCIGYFTISREAQQGEQSIARGSFGVGGLTIMTRRHNARQIQVYLLNCDSDHPELKNVKRGDTEAEKQAFTRIFKGVGWESASLLKSLEEDTDDFYCEHVGVVI